MPVQFSIPKMLNRAGVLAVAVESHDKTGQAECKSDSGMHDKTLAIMPTLIDLQRVTGAEAFRFYIGALTIVVQRLPEEIVAVAFITGHPVSKSIGRMIRVAAGLSRYKPKAA